MKKFDYYLKSLPFICITLKSRILTISIKKKNNTFSFKTQLNYNPKKEKKQGENFISSFHVAKNYNESSNTTRKFLKHPVSSRERKKKKIKQYQVTP